MNISYNWLSNYLKSDLTIDELSHILTDIGLEVDGIEKAETIKGGLEGVVVGGVLTCGKHPDADKLSITTVDVGGEEPLQIVCGAPNVAAGQKVLVATINTTLYPKGEEKGFKIKKSKIRGVESLGMICAEDELGLGDSHDGIMVLPEDSVPGTPAMEALGIEEDYHIEIGLTPNRADAMSHYGVARDVAAWLKANGRKCQLILPSVEAYAKDNDSRKIQIEVIDSDGAPHYSGVTITDIKIAPSPEWLQNYLRAIGMNPHNNVVDITNFVLHEMSQPLHAFDADKIDGGKIVVRTCPEGTKFVTLDGVERTLSGEDLTICSATKPLCLAGVFGGLGSGVTENTTSVFLESAYFNPVRIRKTARRHGLNTDASFRYERGIDPDMVIYGLKRAALLIKEYAGGKISSDIMEIYPNPIEPFRFDLSLDFMTRLIGQEIPEETVKQILRALDVKIEAEKDGVLSVAVPPYRVDVQREADLIEDILRIYGYNKIETPKKVNSSLSYSPKPDKDKITNIVSDFLTANGFTEIMSLSLTKSAYYEGLKSYPIENCVRIFNPLSNDLNVMRQTMLFSMMEAVQLNTNHRNPDLKMYEFGKTYYFNPDKAQEEGLAPYSETQRLAMAVTGNDCQPSWNVKAIPTSFFSLRSSVEKLLKKFGIDIYSLKTESLESDLFSEALSIKLGNKDFMQMGIVAPKIKEMFDIKSDIYFMEMNFEVLVQATKNHKITVQELPKYPEVKRDLALLLDKNITFSQLRDLAFQSERKLLKSVTLFDVYEGDKLPEGKKSYALSFILEDKNATLTDNVIEKAMKNIASRFEKELGATIRS